MENRVIRVRPQERQYTTTQNQTKVHVRTAFGTAGPIVIDAVTKQGGPAFLLKSMLTSSLGHRYLDDVASNDKGVKSVDARETGTPSSGSCIQTRVTTGNSVIFAKDLQTLQKFPMIMEKFQYAYGWFTSWKKTVAYGIYLQEHQQYH